MATTALMSAMRVATARFEIDWGDEVAGMRSGVIRVKQRRPDMWRAQFSIEDMPFSEYRTIRGLLADLQGSRSTFYAWDPGRQYPRADPLGQTAVGFTPQINSVNANMIGMSLRGLPNGYVLSRGDLVSFGVGVGMALHEIRSPATVTASGAGTTPEFNVSPTIRVGTGVNSVATIYRPIGEFMMTPGSLQSQEMSVSCNMSFEAVQVIV
jgi:hypothetical protein